MYYPDLPAISRATTIRRHIRLPDGAAGRTQVNEGDKVDVRTVVAQAVTPARHVILEGQQFFGLKQPDQLNSLMLVRVGQVVQDREPLAGRSAKRGKRLFSPVRGVLVRVAEGRIILQEQPEVIDLEAGVRGFVVHVETGRSVTIEAPGALVQGVWGNGRRSISLLRMEPDEGLIKTLENQFEMRMMGAVVVTRQPLQAALLQAAQDSNLAGIIAPSAGTELRPRLLQSSLAIMLTEGFGQMRMATPTYNLLADFDGQQVTLDASQPGGRNIRRPEAIFNLPAGETVPAYNPLQVLRPGMEVRILREPYMGQVVRVVDLPKKPVLLENGLQVACAHVTLITGDEVPIPLANLEFAGR